MSLPNLEGINNNIGELTDNLKDKKLTKELLMQINDNMLILQKELNFALENLDYSNMPTVKSDTDGMKFQITNNQGSITTIQQSATQLSQQIQQMQQTVNGMQTNISTISQKADQIESTVQSQTTKINGMENDINGINGNIQTIQTDVSNVTQKANSIESTVQSQTQDINGLTTSVSQINQKANQLELTVGTKVGSTEIISKINQSPESIKIQSNRVQIQGSTEIVSPNGRGRLRIDDNSWGGSGISMEIKVNGQWKMVWYATSKQAFDPSNQEGFWNEIGLNNTKLKGNVNKTELWETTSDFY